MRKKITVVVIALLMVSLASGCNFLKLGKGKTEGSKDLGPKEVAEKFWQATKDGKIDEVKKYVTKASMASITDKDAQGSQKGGDFTIGEPKMEGDKYLVPTTLKDKDFTIELKTVVVKEDGVYKVDADQTMSNMLAAAFEGMGKALGEGMKDAGAAVGQALGEGVKGLNEGLKGAEQGMKEFGDAMGKALQEGTKELNDAAKQIAEAPKTTEPGQKSFNLGDSVLVEWHGKWWPAKVIEVGNGTWKIHYDNYDSSWDEWVGASRITVK